MTRPVSDTSRTASAPGGTAPADGEMVEQVLVIDDNDANRYAVARVLKSAGYAVLEAATGGEGLRLVFERRPDLVLLDIRLPDIMGWDVCRAIKSDPDTMLIPVLHVSASFIADRDRVRGLEDGADGYLVHPVDPSVLLATVRALLRLRKAHEAQRESEQRLKQLVDHAPVVLFTVDAAGRYTCFSAGSEFQTLGLRPESLVGRTIEELHADQPAFIEHARRALAGESSMAELPILDRLFEIRFTPLPTGGCVGVATDVTDRHQAEASREEVLAVLAHDLRSPVAAIRFNLDALERVMTRTEPGRATPHDVIARIRQSAGRAERLISDLLDRAQMESGTFHIDRASLDAVRLVREAAELLMPIANAKGVRFLLDAPSESCALLGDRSRLLQALSNLIENAIKFAPAEDGIVTISLERSEREFEFCVRDNGPGMKEEDRARVFDRFWRRPSERRQGVGLGLAIARGIVEAHGGRIWVESRPGAGAKFCFALPRLDSQSVA